MKGWGCKRIDFFIPLFFASDTQKDLDRLLYGMPWKKKSCWNIRRNRQYSEWKDCWTVVILQTL